MELNRIINEKIQTGLLRNPAESEIKMLENAGNNCPDWNSFFFSDSSDLKQINKVDFRGRIILGSRPVIRSSLLENVILGDNNTLSHVGRLSRTVTGNNVEILRSGNIENSSGFTPFSLKISNENGRRCVIAHPDLSEKMIWLISRKTYGNIINCVSLNYGFIGDNSYISNLSTAVNLNMGSSSRVENAFSLKNIFSSPYVSIKNVQVVENAILFSGCSLENGIIASNIVMGEHSRLLTGARVAHTYLGANSTIACCEVLHSFLGAFHEQHHNNSFLIAVSIMGQSNIAAGATIGSNHNSRSPDGEILAGRGFWPGLNVSLKHNSFFSSFNMVAKGSYEHEIYNPFPFSLTYKSGETLCIRPAFLFKYNMYSLARNAWKFKRREKRKDLQIEPDYHFIAPDTVYEILEALKLLNSTENNGFLDSSGYFEKSSQKVSIVKSEEASVLYIEALKYYLFREIFLGYEETGCLPDRGDKNMKWIRLGDKAVPEDLKNEHIESYLPFYRAVLEYLQDTDLEDIIYSSEFIDEHLLLHQREMERVLSSLEKDYSDRFRLITFVYNEDAESIYGDRKKNPFIVDYRIDHEDYKLKLKKHRKVRGIK